MWRESKWVATEKNVNRIAEPINSKHERIRVLRLIARMNIGGPAVQIFGLMEHLPKDEFQQLLVTGFCDSEELDFLNVSESNIPVTRVFGFGRSIGGISEIRAFLQIRKLIRDFDPHIVHTHTAKAGVLGRIASLSTLKPQIRIHTFHGHLLHGYFGSFKTRLVILVERILGKLTHQLVAVGKKVQDDLLSAGIGSSDRFTVIGPGLQLKSLPDRLDAQCKLGIQGNQFTISWVGRLVPIKAPHRILEIARICAIFELDVRFLVVGDGPLRSELQNLALKESLPVDFLGWQGEIESVLSVTDLMLLTSLNEGMPVSLIEAQMAGIPVISSNVGSVSEVINNEESGYCLDYSPIEFAKVIQRVVTDATLYDKLSEKAKSNGLSNFSLKRLIGDYSRLYTQAIRQANS